MLYNNAVLYNSGFKHPKQHTYSNASMIRRESNKRTMSSASERNMPPDLLPRFRQNILRREVSWFLVNDV